MRACQAEQLILYVEQTRDSENLALIAGDFNAVPNSTEYLAMTNHGWLDSHLAAGEAECNSTTGIGCTSGRNSRLDAIESPALNVRRRIDYIFFALPPDNNVCNSFKTEWRTADNRGRLRDRECRLICRRAKPLRQDLWERAKSCVLGLKP